jgi:hypothetical protein
VAKKTKIKHLRKDDQLKVIGEKIRKYRLAKGYTQTELAFECGDKDFGDTGDISKRYPSLIPTICHL